MTVDIHCHLLPGIDDGPNTLEDALRLARHAVLSGIVRSVTTPHIIPERFDNTLESIRSAALLFRKALADHQIPLELGYAAEVRICAEILPMVEERRVPLIGTVDGFDILLIEFPDNHIVPGAEKLLAWLLNRNIRPLIAHPERNKDVMRDIASIAPLVEMGCWMQLTGGSVSGVFGPRCQLRANELMERGWATCIASDAHDSLARLPELEPARVAARRIVGEAESWRLVRDRPAAIAAQNPAFALVR